MKNRNFRPLTRKSSLVGRDDRLFVIAIEGAITEKKYFEDINSLIFEKKNIPILVIPNLDNKSDPDHVTKNLIEFSIEEGIKEDDILWIVIDRDRWTVETLNAVAKYCKDNNVNLAVSNPSFELWLLLHIKEFSSYSSDEIERIKNNSKNGTKRTYTEKEILKILGSYSKRNISTQVFVNHQVGGIRFAVQQAKLLDNNHDELWQHNVGTRVYKLIEQLYSWV